MRRFLRFTIRDLCWLTLVVAVAMGWWLRERELHAQVDKANNRSTKWRDVAGALEHVLVTEGCSLGRMADDPDHIWVMRKGTVHYWPVELSSHEPTIEDD
jgi:hypothetical protein